MMAQKQVKRQYLICVNNAKYRASLELRKVYVALPDKEAEALNFVRVIDESGEDYLYPKSLFAPIELPHAVTRLFARAS